MEGDGEWRDACSTGVSSVPPVSAISGFRCFGDTERTRGWDGEWDGVGQVEREEVFCAVKHGEEWGGGG